MKMMKSLLVAGIVTSLSFAAQATTQQEQYGELKAKVTSKLGLEVSSVKPSEISGLLEVMTQRGIFYTSTDGRYLVRGNIYDTEDGLVNKTEVSMGKMRKDKLGEFEASMITYPAKNEKYKVTVFTDVDCGYCRKLHSQMDEYNRLGITVRYLAFPRGGENSKAWTEMQSLWCSSDQRQAMNALKANQSIAKVTCPNRVPEHYNLGVEFGVTGTPAIILDDGSMIPGYQEPAKLLSALKG